MRPTKKLGQNFVHDPNTVRRIVTAAGVTADDVVLEVGPGLGSLTLALLPACREVIAVEIDPVLAGRLPADGRRARRPGSRTGSPCATTTRSGDRRSSGEPTALVANLPYNVSVPVVLHLLAELPTLTPRAGDGPGRGRRPDGGRARLPKVYGIPSVKVAWYAAGAPGRDGRLGRCSGRCPTSTPRSSC